MNLWRPFYTFISFHKVQVLKFSLDTLDSNSHEYLFFQIVITDAM